MKRYLLALIFFFSGVTAPLAPLRAANTDIANWSGQGTYNAKDMVHVDSNYNLRLYNGSIYLGDNTLTPSVDVTQVTPSISVGGYYGIKAAITFTAAVTNGDVICSSNVATGKGYLCDGSDKKNVLGIADGTYAAAATGWITVGGYALVKTTGTVAIGDILVSTVATSGRAAAQATVVAGSDIGVAMSAGAAAGATVLTRIR